MFVQSWVHFLFLYTSIFKIKYLNVWKVHVPCGKATPIIGSRGLLLLICLNVFFCRQIGCAEGQCVLCSEDMEMWRNTSDFLPIDDFLSIETKSLGSSSLYLLGYIIYFLQHHHQYHLITANVTIKFCLQNFFSKSLSIFTFSNMKIKWWCLSKCTCKFL